MPEATDITLPVSAISYLDVMKECWLRSRKDLVISEYFNFDRFNEIVLAKPVDGQNIPFQPTAVFEPGSIDAAILADLNARSRITLDNSQYSQNPDPAIHPNGACV